MRDLFAFLLADGPPGAALVTTAPDRAAVADVTALLAYVTETPPAAAAEMAPPFGARRFSGIADMVADCGPLALDSTAEMVLVVLLLVAAAAGVVSKAAAATTAADTGAATVVDAATIAGFGANVAVTRGCVAPEAVAGVTIAVNAIDTAVGWGDCAVTDVAIGAGLLVLIESMTAAAPVADEADEVAVLVAVAGAVATATNVWDWVRARPPSLWT